MKLATLKNGTRDGQLVVVSRDLSKYIVAGDIAPTLQAALDDWANLEGKLLNLSDQLNTDKVDNAQKFEQAECESPLPRAYQWADGSAYVNHVELVRKARGADLPESFWSDPLMYQGGSDSFIGPYDDVPLGDESWGIDFEGEVAVITGDVTMGADTNASEKSIRLLMLVNDVSLRGLIPAELAKGFGFFQSKPSSVFSPVAVTPDELGDAWQNGKVHLPLQVHYNEKLFGCAEAGNDMTFSFPQLVAHAAKSRPLAAGAIIGSGTVSNKLDDGPGKPVSDGGKGYSCIAEIRMIETITNGKAETEFMKFGDRIRIEMLDQGGNSIFGAIDQKVVSSKK